MRIGLIAPPWAAVPPASYGGIESVLDRLARGLVAAGHDVLLYTTGDSTCPVPRRWTYPRALHDRVGDSLVELRHVLNAYEALGRDGFDADIVHDHTVIGPALGATVSAPPVVTTSHGPFGSDVRDVYRHISGRVAVIAISECQASSAPDGLPIAAVIHHGLDLEDFPVGSGDDDYVLFLGRMSPTKGAREAALVARQAGVRLLIAGKLRERAEYEYFDEAVAPLLGDDVAYVGELGGSDKTLLLGRARALVNPIQWPEPFGLVMIEALACGTPVLTFPNGAAPEIVTDGETGFLCRDLDDMAERLHEVDRLDRSRCRQVVEARFSTRRMVADHVAAYAKVLAGSTPRDDARSGAAGGYAAAASRSAS